MEVSETIAKIEAGTAEEKEEVFSSVPFSEVAGKTVFNDDDTTEKLSSDRYNLIYNIASKFSKMFPSIPIKIVYNERAFKGVVSNGQILINLKFATKDTPIHEFMHILVQAFKISNQDIYKKLFKRVIHTKTLSKDLKPPLVCIVEPVLLHRLFFLK